MIMELFSQVHIRVKERRSLYARLGFTPSPSKTVPAFVGELGLANLGGKGEFFCWNYYDQICVFIPLQLGWASSEKFEQQISVEIKPAHSTFLTGECFEVSVQKNLNSLQLARVSLLRPLHSLPLGSGLSAFIRRSNNHLPHLNSDLTSLSSGFSLSVCPSSSLTFFSEASASWLHSKYCFDQQQQGNPFIAKWNPNLESAGNYFPRWKLLWRCFLIVGLFDKIPKKRVLTIIILYCGTFFM